MKIALALAMALAAAPLAAQERMANPAIDPETVDTLQSQIASLEAQLGEARSFISERRPEVLELSEKISNADSDTQRILDELAALVEEFKSGSEIQSAVDSSMEDVRGYIDEFRAGSEAQQSAAASLQETLTAMEATDARRDALVAKALAEIRRLEAMKRDLTALRIAGAFQQMAAIYDEMVTEFEVTVNETAAVADSLEEMATLPVP